MSIYINTGNDAHFANSEVITDSDLGIRYSSFRDIDRLLEQTQDMHVGVISWPGGTLAERYTDRYGMEYPGLTNPDSGRPGLEEMMEVARSQDAGLSVVLPTRRYSGNMDQLHDDVQRFMGELLSGQYGPLPKELTFHIGSEHYAHFRGTAPDGAAAEYGRVANAMVNDIRLALHDPAINQIGADIKLSVQAGKTMAEDENIRSAFTDENMREVDLVMHHRYAARADNIENEMKKFLPQLDAWRHDVIEAGGERPDVHLSEWNVASLTRSEGMTRYVNHMADQGIIIHRDDIDEAGRTDTDFENYWQEILTTRDYGAGQPRLYLEMFSQYQANGLGAATIHALDFAHSGRITFTDADKEPVTFVGGEMIEMLYEAVEGTQVLSVSTENHRTDDVSTYAYDSDDRVVVFLAADADKVGGNMTVQIEGLNHGYATVFTTGLSAYVPDDWMERFNIPDNPDVDESNEGNTYALGDRHAVQTTVRGDEVTVRMTHPGEVVRIIVAHTPEEAAEIAEFAGPPVYSTNPEDMALGTDTDVDPGTGPIVVPDPSLQWVTPDQAFAVPTVGHDRIETANSDAIKALTDKMSSRPEANHTDTPNLSGGSLIVGRTLVTDSSGKASLVMKQELFPEGTSQSTADDDTTDTAHHTTPSAVATAVQNDDEDEATTTPQHGNDLHTDDGDDGRTQIRQSVFNQLLETANDPATGLPLLQIIDCVDDDQDDEDAMAYLLA